MREVGIHLEDVLIAIFECPAEAREIGAPQPLLRCPVQHMYPWICRRQLVGNLSGAVGRAVINDQDLEPGVLRQDLGRDQGQVLALVVRGHAHEIPFGDCQGLLAQTRFLQVAAGAKGRRGMVAQDNQASAGAFRRPRTGTASQASTASSETSEIRRPSL